MFKIINKLVKRIRKWIENDDPIEDFKRNYCEYSNGYKNWKDY